MRILPEASKSIVRAVISILRVQLIEIFTLLPQTQPRFRKVTSQFHVMTLTDFPLLLT